MFCNVFQCFAMIFQQLVLKNCKKNKCWKTAPSFDCEFVRHPVGGRVGEAGPGKGDGGGGAGAAARTRAWTAATAACGSKLPPAARSPFYTHAREALYWRFAIRQWLLQTKAPPEASTCSESLVFLRKVLKPGRMLDFGVQAYRQLGVLRFSGSFTGGRSSSRISSFFGGASLFLRVWPSLC